jgi:hypothetical protein
MDGDHGRMETRSSLKQRDRSRVSLRSKFHLALGRTTSWRSGFRQFEKSGINAKYRLILIHFVTKPQ